MAASDSATRTWKSSSRWRRWETKSSFIDFSIDSSPPPGIAPPDRRFESGQDQRINLFLTECLPVSKLTPTLEMSIRRIAPLAGLWVFSLLGSLASDPAPAPLASLGGLSGRLRAAFALPGDDMATAAGPQAERPGIFTLFREGARAFQLIVMKPFSEKVGGRIGAYRLGRWPYEG